jgi:hypothetical protein
VGELGVGNATRSSNSSRIGSGKTVMCAKGETGTYSYSCISRQATGYSVRMQVRCDVYPVGPHPLHGLTRPLLPVLLKASCGGMSEGPLVLSCPRKVVGCAFWNETLGDWRADGCTWRRDLSVEGQVWGGEGRAVMRVRHQACPRINAFVSLTRPCVCSRWCASATTSRTSARWRRRSSTRSSR